jgi:hypothetical protein
VGYTTNTSRVRQHLNAFTVALGEVQQPNTCANKATPYRAHNSSRDQGEREKQGLTEDRPFNQEKRLMPSITVDTANRLVYTLQRLYTLPTSHNSRPVADQLSLSIVHTHRCTGGEIATRSFKGPPLTLLCPLGTVNDFRPVTRVPSVRDPTPNARSRQSAIYLRMAQRY